jgi:ABC-type lipoprotein release transport system permease subunit
VVTWRYETADLLAVQAIRRRALEFVVFILMALAAFGIANTILMAAHERVREVGTLRSMGMTEGGVLRLFLLEGALIGLFGGLLGALWGGALVAHWSKSPIDFSQVFERSQQSLSVSALVYTRFSPSVIAGAVVLGVVISILASIYPARVASRLVPAEAVRANT